MNSLFRFAAGSVPPLIAVALMAGCSTANPKAYSSADAPTRLLTKEANGLRVSVDAVLDRQRSHKYFSTDTLGKGIVPVFVRVKNVASPGSVLVEKERFRIPSMLMPKASLPWRATLGKNPPAARSLAA